MRPDQRRLPRRAGPRSPTTRDRPASTRPLTTPATAPVVVACDLDGVIWRGDEPIAAAAGGIAALRDAGLRVAFVSNNSSIAGRRRGRQARPHGRARRRPTRCVTSAIAAACAARRSRSRPAPGCSCAAAPAWSRRWPTSASTRSTSGPADAVVVGFHRDFDFDELDRASRRRARRRRFVATNLDATYPIPGGLIPGTGALVAAVATAAGGAPEVAGKPEPPTVGAGPGAVRRHRGRGGRPAVDRRRARRRARAGRSRWCCRASTAAVAPPGGEAIPRSAAAVRRRRPRRARARLIAVAVAVALRHSRRRVSCAGDRAPAPRCRARAPGAAREPTPGGRGHRRRAGARRRQPGAGRRPAWSTPTSRSRSPATPPRFVSRGGEKLAAALERFAVDGRRAPGARRRRVHRRVHRLPAPGGRRARGRGRRRAGPARVVAARRPAGHGARAHQRPRPRARRPRRPGRPRRRRPLVHLAASRSRPRCARCTRPTASSCCW